LPVNGQRQEEMGSGIGLTNTQRRLALMYGNKFELNVDDKNPENEPSKLYHVITP
jgi:sensor histidine kinase YesM